MSDLNVLITGGSRGLGRALAFELASRGARVVLAARESPELRATERELRARGYRAYAVAADVGDKRAVYPLLAQATELAGPVDVLINNASTLGPVPLRPLVDTDCEDLERALQVNLIGAFRLSKAVIGSLLVSGRPGVVLNISSDVAVSAYPGWGAYAASKAALAHLSRIWAEELRETPIRILSADPGEMDTRMHADALPDADRSLLARPEEVASRLADLVQAELIREAVRS